MQRRALLALSLAVCFLLPAAAQQLDQNALYQKFLDNRAGDAAAQKVAYEAAQDYLQRFPTPEDDIVKYLRNWSAKYEVADRAYRLGTLATSGNYKEALALGPQVLADDPESLYALIHLSQAGYLAANQNDDSQTPVSIERAQKAISLIESGKTLPTWKSDTDKTQTLAVLHFNLARMRLKTEPAAAAEHLYKAIPLSEQIAKNPATYSFLGNALFNWRYVPQANEYKAKYEGKPMTPESNAAYERVTAELDRVLDAYARAIALCGDDPQLASFKESLSGTMKTLYAARHGSEEGMSDLIAGVLSKPLPQ